MKIINLILISIQFLFVSNTYSQIKIEMKNERGVFTTPCIVNGLKLRFIFDTGASNVSISLSEAIFMLKNGYLNEDDLHGSSYSQIANGNIVDNTTVNIREMEIGGIKLYNINAIIIHELNAPLLLGQSAIQKLGKIQIDDNHLIIMSYDAQSNDDACSEARTLVSQASEHFSKNLYALSADIGQKAYDMCPDVFDCSQFYMMGISYSMNNSYLSAIKYLEKAADCETDSAKLSGIYYFLSINYKQTKDYENAKLCCQKAISFANENEDNSSNYFVLGDISLNQKDYLQAIDYYKKCEELRLKYLSIDPIDVMKGKVKDDLLGDAYLKISAIYAVINQITKSNNYMIKSALCGYEDGIRFCERYNIKYESYIE